MKVSSAAGLSAPDFSSAARPMKKIVAATPARPVGVSEILRKVAAERAPEVILRHQTSTERHGQPCDGPSRNRGDVCAGRGVASVS